MSQIVNIVVEGAKDAYFMHEFIKRRFDDVVRQEIPADGDKLAYNNGEPMEFSHRKKAGSFYRICVNSGFDNGGALKKFLSDSDGSRRLVCTAVVFDADVTGDTDKSGVVNRRSYIESQIASIKKEFEDGSLPFAENTAVFLFPDNKLDGDLETVMACMAKPLHRPFFSVCWRTFQFMLCMFRYLRLSRKSMIYDYVEAMYDRTNKVARVKDKQGYNKNMKADGLWDWSARSLEPLAAFIGGLFKKY